MSTANVVVENGRVIAAETWKILVTRRPFAPADAISSDAPYVQSPAVIAGPIRIRLHLDRMGHVVHSNNGFTLPGYKEPPMKPPPTA